eukprot:14678273-Heterocapsa_arctica.AAC.1
MGPNMSAWDDRVTQVCSNANVATVTNPQTCLDRTKGFLIERNPYVDVAGILPSPGHVRPM